MHPKTMLDIATELVRRVLLLEYPADTVVSRFFRERRDLGPRERATLAETAYAVLRRKPLYEHLARAGSGSRERRLTLLGFQAPRGLIQQVISGHEKVWLDACDAVKPSDLLPQYRHNLPQWLAEQLQHQLGITEFEVLSEKLLEPAPLDLRVNTLKLKRDQAYKALHDSGLEAVYTPYSPWGLRLSSKPALVKLSVYTDGGIEVQDEGSQLLALLLDARRGDMVTDFCAGAGGKTLAIGATMRNTGRLYAFDVSAHRLNALRPRLARSGLSNVYPVAIAHERDERIKRLAGKMDRVLVDAPCSGLGTLRRNPDLKWRQSPSSVQKLVQKQQAILSSSARLLKSGGRLVYATCSLLPAENEAVAQRFGAQHPDFVPADVADILKGLKVNGAEILCTPPAAVTELGDTQSPKARYLRLWPHQHHTDGFFAAVWHRR